MLTKRNVNFSAILFIILLTVSFDFIIYNVMEKKIPDQTILLFTTLIVIEVISLFFLREWIYNFKMDESGIQIQYVFKNKTLNYSLSEIDKIVLKYNQRNAMNNIKFSFVDGFKISVPTSQKEELKGIFNFCKKLEIECNVIGLPTGRIPSDYNWSDFQK